jgi:GTP-binding protein Era
VVEEVVEVDPDGDQFTPVEPGTGRLVVRATLFVERDSQKGIIIGRGGSRLKEVGSRARGEINALLGRKVHLDLRVKVAKDWQRDPKQLGRLGF